jgi:hypothetical protein
MKKEKMRLNFITDGRVEEMDTELGRIYELHPHVLLCLDFSPSLPEPHIPLDDFNLADLVRIHKLDEQWAVDCVELFINRLPLYKDIVESLAEDARVYFREKKIDIGIIVLPPSDIGIVEDKMWDYCLLTDYHGWSIVACKVKTWSEHLTECRRDGLISDRSSVEIEGYPSSEDSVLYHYGLNPQGNDVVRNILKYYKIDIDDHSPQSFWNVCDSEIDDNLLYCALLRGYNRIFRLEGGINPQNVMGVKFIVEPWKVLTPLIKLYRRKLEEEKQTHMLKIVEARRTGIPQVIDKWEVELGKTEGRVINGCGVISIQEL